MYKIHVQRNAIKAVLCIAMTGCVTPMMTRHDVRLESVPAGAEVTFKKGHFAPVIACTTPCTFDTRDYFGFMSRYEFVARKAGYADAVIVFEEPTIFHAQGIVPESVSFTLKAAP